MPRPIGVVGVFGALLVIGGIVVIGYRDPLIAGGMAAILAGVLLVVRDLLKNLLAQFGFGGAF